MTDEAALEEFTRLMQDPAARQAFVDLKKAHASEAATPARYQHVLRAVFSTPWVILHDYMQLVSDVLVRHMAGFTISASDLERIEAARRQSRPAPPQGVAVLPLHGVIVPKASLFSDISGATSVEGFRSMFRAALADPDVGSIVLDVDSPGGSAEQIPEMAQEIRESRGRKPITAVANGMSASGAYWLASQADEFVATRSGIVGSIGVITAHEDMSKAAEMAGLKVTTVATPKFKGEMTPFEPLSSDAEAHIRSMVDEFYSMFVSDVAKGRGVSRETVRKDFGEGRVVTASVGVKQGMIDRIATLEDVIGERMRAMRRPAAAAFDGSDEVWTSAGTGEPMVRVEVPLGEVGELRVETPDPEPEVEPVEVDPDTEVEPDEPSELEELRTQLDLLKM